MQDQSFESSPQKKTSSRINFLNEMFYHIQENLRKSNNIFLKNKKLSSLPIRVKRNKKFKQH